MTNEDWVRIPPKNTDESPEEIRRQRDLYRDVVQSMLHNEWKDGILMIYKSILVREKRCGC
jgi:hypothetical protein